MRSIWPWGGTLIAIILGAAIVLPALLAGVDLVKINPGFLMRLQGRHIDDVICGFLVISLGLGFDLAGMKRRNRSEVQEQRLRVLRATMNTVHDIVNNFLTGVQLFRLDSENCLSEESLECLDKLIADTSAELKRLGDMESTPEKQMAIGVGIDYRPNKER
jgi:hypothetical protein